jgi:hypothetical protein
MPKCAEIIWTAKDARGREQHGEEVVGTTETAGG